MLHMTPTSCCVGQAEHLIAQGGQSADGEFEHLCVCVCVCVYVCMYVCMYVFMCVWGLFICVYMCIYVCGWRI
jgi:hypothetical protein